MTDWTA